MTELAYQVKKLQEEAAGYFNRFDNFTEKKTYSQALLHVKSRAEKIIADNDLKRSPATKSRLDFIIYGAGNRLKAIGEEK
jgi:hypothetical protein